jgi:hypothetical protein
MSDIEATIEATPNTVDNSPLEKIVTKKPRSQKQMEAFKNAQDKRAENVKLRKDNLTAIKNEAKVTKVIKPVVQSDQESEEEEILYIKKPSKKKIKKKTVIIEDSSSSEEDSESESEDEPRQRKQFITQQNKKSKARAVQRNNSPSIFF